MVTLPIDIVNYICEFAAGDDKLWYPFFSPKTGKVTWKVNPYCLKYIDLSNKLMNPIKYVNLLFYNVKTNEEIEKQCKIIILNEIDIYIKKIYIEFDSDDNNNGKFMLRAMLNIFNHIINPDISLYLNGTEYATINFGWISNIWNRETAGMIIEYETY